MILEPEAPPRSPQSKPLTKYHHVIGYTYVDRADVVVPHERGRYRIVTNSDGLRSDREYTPEKNPVTYRILLFGASFTAAARVSNTDRYSDLLEKEMKNTEVINFGLPGSGTDQQLLMFREKGLKYEFDLILICPLLENIRRNLSRYRITIDRESGREVLVPKPYFELVNDRLELSHVPVSQERPRIDQATKEMLSKTDFGGERRTYFLRSLIN